MDIPKPQAGKLAQIPADRFTELLLNSTPLIDVRAECEYHDGHIPHSVNLPLLNDGERAEVGTCYKRKGQEAAITLGTELVSGDTKKERMSAWIRFIADNPTAVVLCFRGGLRSQTVQKWLAESGLQRPLISGGYKALRRHLLRTTIRVASEKKIIIVAGKTGTGKTHLINNLTRSVDLEGLANHRGSAFGRRVSAQPAQSVFENLLALDLLRQEREGGATLFLEDESRAIGSISLPLELHRAMSVAPIVRVEESLDFRVETILNDYIVSNLTDFRLLDPVQGDFLFSESLLASLDRIKKRLGGERHSALRDIMSAALTSNNDHDQHRAWIRGLLVDYYDPMYEYQMTKKARRVVFKGDSDTFLEWASEFDQLQT
ncbi:tRNA 2-selenouridine(34) synthase MnmH [Gammaproteobacteria bacterium]|jgi:tRNA 2-selenouridine synthase|nr:tRNA 2-selenouridine(34) synthase MnmH [Gammaproteobacteria bacterium]MCH9854460.1 tRNA 2-selenouridine(34) synthase MnmH [Gammaproteobacteria bacterium]MDA7782004.1 tRNA 2-selenouridine(34) synthase MnmH [Gammaproteobacteria bacterium]MDA9784376.1 tRNA 2-selenouridine(34) synthase MnmH [Gammaproteobacteria bacterium]MDB4003487.1 tRNA 2-selenouridine(34) synthase MnmH [Gammaproteobacteria bacterium]